MLPNLSSYQLFGTVLGCSEVFWVSLAKFGCSGMFLTALKCYWLFWDILDYTELFYLVWAIAVWASLGCSEVFLPGVGYSGLLWSVQCCSGLLKGCCELFWAALLILG